MRVFTLVILLMFVIYLPNVNASTNTNSIDLSVKPGKVLFDLSNVKPGDSMTRTFKLENTGNGDFDYDITNEFTGGSEKFYNQLYLKIENDDGVLFEGKLHEFSKLESRQLKSKTNESMLFFIKIPMELGNEYQGLTTDFQFDIYVEGTLGGVIPVDNRLPETATNLFNFIIIGAALVFTGGSMFLYQRRKKLNIKKEF